jgi:hypothetical protein
MKKTVTIFSLVATAFALQAADSAVTFQNNVFTPSRLVTFDSTFGALSGSGVRNGVAGTASYVAQLFTVVGGVETAVGATANFRAASTSSPGTWSGASRTLTGVAPATAVNLVVKVWDNSVASYEAASAGQNLGFGKSAVFSYTQPDPVLLPSDTWMSNFAGFSITQSTGVIPEPSTVALAALGVAGLVFLRRK